MEDTQPHISSLTLNKSCMYQNPRNKHICPISMMNPLLITHLSLPLILAILVAGDSLPLYNPVEDITVKCGHSGHLTDPYDKRTWIGDINSEFTPIEHQAPTSTSTTRKLPPPIDQVSYSSARLSYTAFTYTFNLTAGQKFIRFYFYASSYYTGFDRSEALFSVKAGGFTLLNGFNSSLTADAFNSDKIYREFCLNIDENQPSLTITISPSTAFSGAYAFINGIEIVSMPPNLYYNMMSKHVGSDDNTFQIQNNSALEKLYRINNGGDEIMFGQDTTGMYRNWDGWDQELRYMDYSSINSIRQVSNVDVRLNFSAIPEYTAPEKVYQTGSIMVIKDAENKSNNLTWVFPVDAMFFYLVRLHFCVVQPEITQTNDGTFSIFMNDQLAEQKADVIAWSGGNGRPVYKDYMIYVEAGPNGRQKNVNFSLELQTNPNDPISAILNGVEIFKLNDTTSNLAGPNPDQPKDPTSNLDGPNTDPPKDPPKSNNKRHSRSLTFILAIVGGALISISALVVLGVFVFRRRGRVQKYKRSIHGAANSTKSRGSSSLPAELCYSFSLAEIKAATQNFDESCTIGRGGFGNVYKGYIDLDGGASPVAVKRLKPESSQGAQEFKTEIEMLSQLRHRHLVPLVGYCTEKGEMILVYDYMAQGTLAGHLYHTENPPLSWEQRLQICVGAARGLRYLHGDVDGTIIHRDVKSTNILLDENWVAKVADFGLSKMGMTTNSKTHISTAVKGSFGYLDPEYYRRHQLTEKSDVYSFGVVLCEVLCARPALLHTAEANQISLAEWAKSCHGNGTLDGIVDPNLAGKIEMECLNKFVEIAMSCIHDKGSERPSMNEVVKGLEFALQLHQSWIQRNGVNDVSAKTYNSIEQSSSGYDSVKCISQTIFSEVNNLNGR